MARLLVACALWCVLAYVASGASLKGGELKGVNAKRFANLQVEIDEWNRLGKPSEIVFQHVANVTSTAKLTALPEETLLGSPNYEANVFFYAYNRDNPDGSLVTKNVADFEAAGWKANRQTKIVIHGFGNNIRSQIFLTLVPALLANGDYNVIGVDWGKLCKQPWYIEARSRVGPVGKQIASLVDFLVNNGLLETKNLHVIGHSLGAHVSGNVGKHVTSGDVARITGLDPAMPLFLILKSDRLHKNDATLVDIVHTCSNLAGLEEEIGDLDFYPNGGSHPQPGCGVDLLGTCSHSRAYQLWGESAYEKSGFPAELCNSKDAATQGNCEESNATANMGVNLRYEAPGAYFLKTASSSPYDLAAHEVAERGA